MKLIDADKLKQMIVSSDENGLINSIEDILDLINSIEEERAIPIVFITKMVYEYFRSGTEKDITFVKSIEELMHIWITRRES